MKYHTQNVVEKLFPDPLLKNLNWSYLWINSLKFYKVCFYCMPSWQLLKYIETKLETYCFNLIWSFSKKRDLELVSLYLIFCMIFEDKYFLLYTIIMWPNFIVWLLLYFVRYYMYCDCLLTRLRRHKLWD